MPDVAGGPYGTGNLQTDRLLDILMLEHRWTERYKPPPSCEQKNSADLDTLSISFKPEVYDEKRHEFEQDVEPRSSCNVSADLNSTLNVTQIPKNSFVEHVNASESVLFSLNLPPPKFS